MRLITEAVVGGILILTGSFTGTRVAGQNAGDVTIVRSIDVSNARPVLRALEQLRDKYHLAITYEEPRYVYEQDLQDISYMHRGPIPAGVKLMAPRGGTIHFQYAETNGRPQEDVTTLIRRLVGEYAAQGGPVFDVRERTLPKGVEWNVIALKARDSSGSFVDQPDILGATINLPKARRNELELWDAIGKQLTTETGYRVTAGPVVLEGIIGTLDVGAENVPARDFLANLCGLTTVWDLDYDPENGGKYALYLIAIPGPPLRVHPVAPSQLSTTQPHGPGHLPIVAVGHMMTTRPGRLELQSKLAQAGYYTGEPTGAMDANTVDALKKFQAANNLPVTGTVNPETIRKLGLDIIPARP